MSLFKISEHDFFFYKMQKKRCQSELPIGKGYSKLPIALGKMADFWRMKRKLPFFRIGDKEGKPFISKL